MVNFKNVSVGTVRKGYTLIPNQLCESFWKDEVLLKEQKHHSKKCEFIK